MLAIHFVECVISFIRHGAARERPWSEVDEADYKHADSIYVILRLKMLGKLKKNGSI